MPAIFSKLNVACLIGACVFSCVSLFSQVSVGQQTPSQRYLPVRQSAYDTPQRNAQIQGARRLPSPYETRQGGALAPAPRIPNQSQYYPESSQRLIQPTSYQEPYVPEILKAPGSSASPAPTQADRGFVPPEVSPIGVANNTMPQKSMAEYSSALGIKTTPLAPQAKATVADQVSQEMSRMRQLDQARRQTQATDSQTTNVPMTATKPVLSRIPVNAAPLNGASSNPDAANRLTDTGLRDSVAPATRLPAIPNASMAAAKTGLSGSDSPIRVQSMNQRMMVTQAAAGRVEAQNAQAIQAAAELPTNAGEKVSATQFVADINRQQLNQEPQQTTASPRLVATQAQQPGATALKMATGMRQEPKVQPLRGGQNLGVRTASNDIIQPAAPVREAQVRLPAPALNVVTQGPETIGINKPAQFQVVVENNSIIAAERVLVGVNIPSWVDIENVTLTSGGKEVTDGKKQARLVWSVDQIEGNSTQTLTITAVPRKAEMFDLGVEWTLVPRNGKAAIRVTEPKLEMSIAGPKEVLYGETALYHVTVRNPGTGAAENVMVMLPEALGGERDVLGTIPPGKEQNFQVELLARTAGDLNLVATATAEGNLKTSAERALIVRRANLQVGMTGPAIRYSGDVGKYQIKITNNGDATAQDVIAVVALPPGVKYLSGIDSVKVMEGGMRWQVGSLDQQETKTYTIHCQLNTSGDLQLEVGAQGKGDLAGSGACQTSVETIADLVLSVSDLKGPLPTGEPVPYTIKIRNRGTKAAKAIALEMLFSDGVEPKSAKGLQHQIKPGQVRFVPIQKIDPGQEVTLEVTAVANKSGNHVFRAQLKSEESEAHEIAEGTTRFYGDTIEPPAAAATATENNSFGGGSFK